MAAARRQGARLSLNVCSAFDAQTGLPVCPPMHRAPRWWGCSWARRRRCSAWWSAATASTPPAGPQRCGRCAAHPPTAPTPREVLCRPAGMHCHVLPRDSGCAASWASARGSWAATVWDGVHHTCCRTSLTVVEAPHQSYFGPCSMRRCCCSSCSWSRRSLAAPSAAAPCRQAPLGCWAGLGGGVVMGEGGQACGRPVAARKCHWVTRGAWEDGRRLHRGAWRLCGGRSLQARGGTAIMEGRPAGVPAFSHPTGGTAAQASARRCILPCRHDSLVPPAPSVCHSTWSWRYTTCSSRPSRASTP